MPQMPESENTAKDFVDAVIESWKEEKFIDLGDGHYRPERVIDERRAWWQMHHIGTNVLGRYALERENLGNLFKNAGYHMTAFRADALQKQGLLLCKSYDYSIDAKSSECMRDPNNTQQTLVSMFAKAKTDRQFTVKGEVEKSIWDGIVGKKANEASN